MTFKAALRPPTGVTVHWDRNARAVKVTSIPHHEYDYRFDVSKDGTVVLKDQAGREIDTDNLASRVVDALISHTNQ